MVHRKVHRCFVEQTSAILAAADPERARTADILQTAADRAVLRSSVAGRLPLREIAPPSPASRVGAAIAGGHCGVSVRKDARYAA